MPERNNAKPKNAEQEAALFGEYDNLLGVFQPAGPPVISQDFGVILVTPGMLHSAGPFRLYRDVASSLSRAGLSSLRFDLSGIGESLGVGRQGTSLQRAADEIGEAIDWLQSEQGIKRVGLFGLCSGADDAMYTALADPRVVSLFSMDGCGYRTAGYRAQRIKRYYLPKIASPSKWISLIRSSLGLVRSTPVSLEMGMDIREFPSRQEASRQICTLADRDVSMHFHYTGGVDEYYNYEQQFADMFPEVRDARVTNSFTPQCDHVAFLTEHRKTLVRQIADYFEVVAGKLPDLESEAGLASAVSSPICFPVPDISVSVAPVTAVP